ncbi:hypothetical protein [Planococcus sp. ISL-109]|uniref:hypothetical protein n=1 Tax=Planococcus sp. ISL-109 TaxID=2819166 RepID=UPI00333D4E85
MSAPIIPSIVPNTILVPIAGYIFRNRFETIRTKVLDYADTHRDAQQVVFDFTGVTMQDVQSFDFNELALELNPLNSALKLMGLRSIYVGFNPRFVQKSSMQAFKSIWKSIRRSAAPCKPCSTNGENNCAEPLLRRMRHESAAAFSSNEPIRRRNSQSFSSLCLWSGDSRLDPQLPRRSRAGNRTVI